MLTEPRVGDQIVYNGRLFWLAMKITLGNGVEQYLIRQAHWGEGFHILVNRKDVLLDPPPVA